MSEPFVAEIIMFAGNFAPRSWAFCNGQLLPAELDLDADGVTGCSDCNDLDADNYPGNTELCDGADNNCDGSPAADEADAEDAEAATDKDKD